MHERLQKVLARAGVASRRASEELMKSGRVTVDGRIVNKLGTKVDLGASDIRVDGRRIGLKPRLFYVFNKPSGVLATSRDEKGRRTITDVIRSKSRLYPVGGLDIDAEGLVLLTNDGEFCNRLVRLRSSLVSRFHIVVKGAIPDGVKAKIEGGIWFSDGRTRSCRLNIKKHLKSEDLTILELAIVQNGIKREIRRIFARFDLKVKRLVRIQYGDFSLSGLRPGEYKLVDSQELRRIFNLNGDKHE